MRIGNALVKQGERCKKMVSSKFKKGDLVIIDVSGKPTEYEIVSSLISVKKSRISHEPIYEARNLETGFKSTISEDQILRLATPVDNSAELFDVRTASAASSTKKAAK
jgi:hypothetical protein